MSLFTPSASLLAVGQCAVGLLRAKQPVNATEIAEFDAGDSTSLQGALRSVLEKGGTAALDVVLSDDIIKLFVVDPPAGLTRFSDLEAVATVRFEELFGLEAAEWRISADWHAQRRFMASAAPRWLLAALDDRSRKVVCIEPAFVRSCNALAREPFEWLVCRYPDYLTAASFDGATCQLVRSGVLEANQPWAPWLQREALLANRPLRRVAVMASNGVDHTAKGVADVRTIEPPRHMQLLATLRLSASVTA